MANPLLDDLYEMTLGEMGIQTGSLYNNHGYQAYRSMQALRTPCRVPAAATRRGEPMRGQPMFPFIDRWLQRVPGVVYFLLTALGTIAGLAYGFTIGAAERMAFGINAAIWYGVAGLAIGLFALPALGAVVKLVLIAGYISVLGVVVYLVIHFFL